MRRLIGVVGVVALVAVALWWWLSRSEPRIPETAASAPVTERPAAAAVAPAPAVAVRQPSNELPRPAPRPPDVPPPPSVKQGFETQAQQRHGPVDKRGNPGPRAAAEMEMVSYAFETLDDDIDECLAEWRKTSSDAPPEVMLGFEIDKDGLQRSWVDADGGVPFGVRTCFANAVYGLDWSHIVDQPAMLTNRFNLADGGR